MELPRSPQVPTMVRPSGESDAEVTEYFNGDVPFAIPFQADAAIRIAGGLNEIFLDRTTWHGQFLDRLT